MVGGALFWPFLVPCGCYSSFLGLFDSFVAFPSSFTCTIYIYSLFTVVLHLLPSVSLDLLSPGHPGFSPVRAVPVLHFAVSTSLLLSSSVYVICSAFCSSVSSSF